MINEIKEVQTSYNLNPQRFNNLKCKQHQDQIVTWVCLENDREAKLLCNLCANKEKDFDPNPADNSKKTSLYVEYKTFLKNLYTYSTLEEADPERFSSELVQCLDGAKQPEKLKLYMMSVGQMKTDLKKDFTNDICSKFEEFQKEIIQQIEKAKQTFLTFIEEQIDLLFSREILSIKQFKDRGCKMILSAAKSAGQSTSISEEITAFESVSQAINRMHSGKVELSYAKEHSIRIFKSLLSDFDKKVIVEAQEIVQKNLAKQIPDIQSTHIFTPWKKQNAQGSSNRPINFSYLQHANTQNEINKTKRESFSSISEAAKTDSKRSINMQGVHNQSNSIEAVLRKNPSNTFIIKPVPQGTSNSRRESYLTPQMKKVSDDNITLRLNLKSEIMNSLIECNSPKNGYLVNNQQRIENNKTLPNSSFQQAQQQQSNQQQYTVYNPQKSPNNLSESIYKDNNYLTLPNNVKDNNFLQIPNSVNNKQPSGTSLFSSFSSTLRTKSSTSITFTNQSIPIEPVIQQTIPSNQPPFQDKFNRKLNFQKNHTTIANSTENLQHYQLQSQIPTEQSDTTDRDPRKYYIGKAPNNTNEGKSQFQRNRTPQSGLFLSPNPKDQIQGISGLNTSEKNISLNNHSQSQTRDNYDQEPENNSQVHMNKQSNKLKAYTNQVKIGNPQSGQSLSQPQTPLTTQSSGSMGSRMKNNIIKNVLINNTTKQISQDNLKHSKEIIQEKPFKYNLLQILRIPLQANVGQNFHEQPHSSSNLPPPRARKVSPDSLGENGKRSNSNSPPKDSKENNQNSSSGIGSSGKLEESSNFLLAQPDGYVSLYNVQGRNINQIFREKTHTKLNSIAIGRTGGMFFTAGEHSKTSSIKLWIFHSHQRFSELVELKMVDSNIKKIFFIKEEYASRLNKLSFAIWTQTVVEPIKSEVNKSPLITQAQQQPYTVNKVGIWNLEFAGNKFEGAKMFNVSNVELPINTLGVTLKEDEMLAYTKDTLTLYVMMNEYSSIHKKSHQKFINVIKKDTLCGVRSYQQSKLTQKNYFAFSESGYVITLNDQLNIIQEKSVRDLSQKPITLEDAILYDPDCDHPENSRFMHFFKKDNTTLYVFDLENLRVVDELQSFDEIKNIFFYGSGYYLGFEQYYVRIWKPLPQKQEIISSITTYDD